MASRAYSLESFNWEIISRKPSILSKSCTCAAVQFDLIKSKDKKSIKLNLNSDDILKVISGLDDCNKHIESALRKLNQ
ncbi:hypothetical protein ACTXT7_006819 [Hymenolepis weldensis]